MKLSPQRKRLANWAAIALFASLAVPHALTKDNQKSNSASSTSADAKYSPTEQLTDQNIASAVKEKLDWDSGLEDDQIEVAVKNGKVMLDGKVASLTEKQRAAAIARGRKGVTGIENNLIVESSEKPDDELRTTVAEAINDDNALDSSNITAQAKDGTIVLEGTVDCHSKKDLAEEVAGDVAGVESIENRIEVASTPDERSDDELKQAIRNRIDSDAWLDPANIDVQVNNGTAILAGMVASADVKERARTRAQIRGITEVDVEELEIDQPSGTSPEVAETRRENQDGDPSQNAEQSQESGTRFRKMMSDSEIKESLTAYLREDVRLSNADIEIDVQDSVVTLSGEVEDRLAKKTAEREASNIYSVREVRNNIEVASDPSTDSQTLKERAQKAIARNATLEQAEIDIQVEDNEVSLNGTVDSTYARNKSETVISGLRGVQEVNNNLEVQTSRTTAESSNSKDESESADAETPTGFTYYSFYYTYPDAYDWSDEEIQSSQVADASESEELASAETEQPEMTDAELSEKVRDEIFWSWFVDEDDVNVEVNNGTVMLTGTVEDLGEKEAAVKNARDAGAAEVKNQLQVAQR